MYRYEKYLRPDRGLFPLSELAQKSADDFGSKVLMRTWNGKGYDELTYAEFGNNVQSIAKWLVDQGIKNGDKIAVLSENRPEWGATYLGVQAAGAIIVPVDSMMPSSGIRHIISDSKATMLFVSGKFLKVMQEMEPISSLGKTICYDENDISDDTLALKSVISEGTASKAELPKRNLDEMAAIIYTSGTTGHSKGVMLSQKNIMSNVAGAARILPLGTSDTYLSVLPLHHTYECTAGFLLPIYCGCGITYAHSLKSSDLLSDMRNTNVTIMVAVPLLYEKMYLGITRKIKKKSAFTRFMFKTLFNLSGLGIKMGQRWGEKLFKSMRTNAGLGSVIFFVSGGGPLDPAVSMFFNRLGILTLQGFGLSETSPLTHVNLPAKIRDDTVGPPIVGVEHRIDNPNEQGIGEIIVRGPNVFLGYYKNEDATKEVLSEDGWFRTGDLGKIFDDDMLKITGRMKNMLVTAGGKNVYPEEIEHLLNRSDFIGESVVLGFQRESGYGDQVAALIYPDYEQVDIHFEELGQKPTDEDVTKLIKSEIRKAQVELQDYKHIHRFRIVEEEFQKTSTRKIKRYLYSGDMLKVNGEKI